MFLNLFCHKACNYEINTSPLQHQQTTTHLKTKEKMKIKKLIVPATNTTYEVGVNAVVEIVDNSQEWESSFSQWYQVWSIGKKRYMSSSTDGLGVQIEYFAPE